MTPVEYARFNWPDVTVTVDDQRTMRTEYKRVEVDFEHGTARMRSRTTGDTLDVLQVAPDENGIIKILRVDRDHYDLVADDGTIWQIYRGGCGCG